MSFSEGDCIPPRVSDQVDRTQTVRSDPRGLVWEDAFFDLAPASYQHVCRHWVMGARQESTRQRRLAELVADCADGRLIKSQRYGTAPAWVERHRTRLGLGASEGTPGEPGAI